MQRYEVVPEIIKDGRKRIKQFLVSEIASGNVLARFADESKAEEVVDRLNNTEE